MKKTKKNKSKRNRKIKGKRRTNKCKGGNQSANLLIWPDENKKIKYIFIHRNMDNPILSGIQSAEDWVESVTGKVDKKKIKNVIKIQKLTAKYHESPEGTQKQPIVYSETTNQNC